MTAGRTATTQKQASTPFMTELSSPPGLSAENALFLDFDGTLAAFRERPEGVSLPDGGDELLIVLKAKLNDAIALISGRDIRDLSTRTPHQLWRIGGHGLEICEPGQTPSARAEDAPAELVQAVETSVALLDDVWVEHKGPVLAVHYRAAPDARAEIEQRMNVIMSAYKDYSVQAGKMVFEAKPSRANKGRALKTTMDGVPFQGRVPVMVGDDATDEDAMRQAKKLGGYGIKVGLGETCADYRLADVDAVWEWIRKAANS